MYAESNVCIEGQKYLRAKRATFTKKCVFAANSCVLSIFFQLQNEDGFLKTTFLLFTTVLSLL